MKRLFVFVAVLIIGLAFLIQGLEVKSIEQKQYPGQTMIEYGDGSRKSVPNPFTTTTEERNDNKMLIADESPLLRFKIDPHPVLYRFYDSSEDYFTAEKITAGWSLTLHGDYTLKPIGDNKYEIKIKGE